MKPVYMINGFLESGKTEFITYTLAQPYFQVRGKTLLLLCEEGENEYDEKLLRLSRTELELIGSEAEFNSARLIELEKKHKPERIIIEYNGMWNYKEMKLPWHWKIEQQVTTIDASTFPMYFTNMKSLLAEQIRKSEMIIFNRCDDVQDLSSYKRNVKAINPKAEIIFEDANGEINEIMEEDLPYDLKADVIHLVSGFSRSSGALRGKEGIICGHGIKAWRISEGLFCAGPDGDDLLRGGYGISRFCM